MIHNSRAMNEAAAKGCLYVVATPIGNLDDITLRALSVLAEADLVAAEDTRHTRGLLARHGIDRPLASLHEHNEERKAAELVGRLAGGARIALVSDAGTPLVSDPGYRLVLAAVAAGIDVVAVPGPSAVTAALSVAGLPTDRFVFEGFLPARAAARRERLAALRGEARTMVFFESSHRIEDSLADIEAILGADREMAVCRELTKQFETVLRGAAGRLRERVATDADQRRGEFVLVVAGAAEGGADWAAALALGEELRAHLGASQAARIAARIHGVARRELYRALGGDGEGSPGVGDT